MRKYILVVTGLGLFGFASLSFGGKPGGTICSCLAAYNDAYQQQCKPIKDRATRNACTSQLSSDFQACMATTGDPACLAL